MAAPDLSSTGQRIAWYRQRLGMSQRDLAQAISRTPGWISTVERGNAEVERISTLQALAAALEVTAVDLCPGLGVAASVAPQPEADALAAMLATIPGLVGFLAADPPTGGGPSLSESRQRVQRLQRLLRAQDYTEVVTELLELIPLIGAAEHARPNSQWTILRTDLYDLAARVLVALNHPAPAWVAMDRGIFLTTTPREYADYWLAMLLRLAELHATLARTDWAIGTARNVVTAAAHYVDTDKPSVPHLVIAGAAHLLLAVWEATENPGHDTPRQEGAGRAAEDLDAAAGLVARLPAGENSAFGYSLGPSSLTLARITVAVAQGDHDRAVTLGGDLEPTTLPTDTQRALLDIQLALARVGRGEFDPALAYLVAAEAADPYEMTVNPAAQRAIGELAALKPRNTRLPDALRDLLAHLRGGPHA